MAPQFGQGMRNVSGALNVLLATWCKYCVLCGRLGKSKINSCSGIFCSSDNELCIEPKSEALCLLALEIITQVIWSSKEDNSLLSGCASGKQEGYQEGYFSVAPSNIATIYKKYLYSFRYPLIQIIGFVLATFSAIPV